MACSNLLVIVLSKALVSALPIAQIAIGATYLNDCPREPFIPIYVIVVGVFLVIAVFISPVSSDDEPEDGTFHPLTTICKSWNLVTFILLFWWIIAGSMVIFSVHEPEYNNPGASSYCNKTVYRFAFWTTVVFYFLGGWYSLFIILDVLYSYLPVLWSYLVVLWSYLVVLWSYLVVLWSYLGLLCSCPCGVADPDDVV